MPAPSTAQRIADALERIADALEKPQPRKRSWAAIYGSARKHIKPANLGREFEATLDAHTVFLEELDQQFGDSPDVFPIIRKYNQQLLTNTITMRIHGDALFKDKGVEYCRSIAHNLVAALEQAGLWD